jgi:protease PrsW
MANELITHIYRYLSVAFEYLNHSYADIIQLCANPIGFMMADISHALSGSPTFLLQSFIYALIGGLFPALIWLWFWMHESHEHKEPRHLLWLTFVCGMCAVFIVYPLQKLAVYITGESPDTWTIVFIWAALEELLKYIAAYIFGLRDKVEAFDEPIDAFVYLMTASLGFAAMENTLFLLAPLLDGNTISSILVGNMRFMGANLLHVASSGLLSLFIAFAYFKPVWVQRVYALIGLSVAFTFHATFNYVLTLIDNGIIGKEKIFLAFSFVWITLIILILALEKVKKIKEF